MLKRPYLGLETPAGYSHVFQTWTALNSTDLGSVTCSAIIHTLRTIRFGYRSLTCMQSLQIIGNTQW